MVASTQSNRPPDVFLIGVPRAATTSLYEALGRHPQIYAPALKEACFTCPDVDPRTHHRVETLAIAKATPFIRRQKSVQFFGGLASAR